MTDAATHPTDDALVAAARGEGDASTREHAARCEACATRSRRLAAGASLIALARAEVPSVDWRAVDPQVLAAAEATARSIREGTARAPRSRSATLGYVGAALAVAAAGVFALHVAKKPADDGGSEHVVASAPRAPVGVQPAVAPVRAVARAEGGVVLLVASPVAYTEPSGGSSVLTGSTRVRQGGRIAVGDRGGRAVVALRAGCRLDARSGAQVRVASLTPSDTTVALEQGEARLDASEPANGERVAMESSGWTVAAKGGAFVAKVERDVVRVRVVEGGVALSRGAGSEERRANAGDEVELSRSGDGIRVVAHDASDGAALDESVLADEGDGFELPALGERASSVTVAGHGALPPGVGFVRSSTALSLEASTAGESLTLALEPGHPAPSAWHHSARVVAASAPRVAPPPLDVAPVALAVGGGGSTPPTSVPAARPAPDGLGASARARWIVAEQLRVAIADCGVAPGSSLTVAMDPNEDGTVTSPRVSGVAIAPAARACVEHHALALRLPREALPRPLGTVQLELTTP